MQIQDFLGPADVHVGLRATTKERLLDDLSGRVGRRLAIAPATILAALLDREALGSTGTGDGIGLPHARLPGIVHPAGLLATLRSRIDFRSVDERPVDIVVMLLLPVGSTGEHLSPLAAVARRLRIAETAAAVRRARTAHEAFAALTGSGSTPDPSVGIA